MFNPDRFNSVLSTSWLGQSFIFKDEIASTNTFLKQLDSEDLTHGLVLLADDQTMGRGQYERTWYAEPGKNLTFSIAMLPARPERFHVLTLSFALAMCELVESSSGKHSDIKWANDVYVDGKKIAGLLTETIFTGQKLNRLVIGIGFNINQVQFPEQVKDIATSLHEITGSEMSREEVLAELLARCEHYYRLWHQNDQQLIKKINAKLIGVGEWVKVEVNDAMMEGEFKFIGINEKGNLLVLNKELEAHTFSYEQIKIHIT